MAVREQDWTLSKRGNKDAARHREKVKEAIKKNIADIISDEAIITKKGDKTVKIPIRGLKSYRFIYDRGGGGGFGQGDGKGKPGDIIGRRKKPGQQPGQKAGDQPGVDYLETEIDIEELIEMMLEDLALPNLKKKKAAEVEVPKGFTFDSVEKVGLKPNLDKKRTIKEAILRTAGYIRELMEKTGRGQEECAKALDLASGDMLKAEEILKDKNFTADGSPTRPYFDNPDIRYHTLKEDMESQSNAVVIAMMDVSGSMDNFKKYIARSFFWWMVQFLKTKYQRVEIRFISHTTEAQLVSEEDFFYKGESGGTQCSSAYELALHLTETEYDPEKWNVYAFHFSDGEDWDTGKTAAALKKLLPRCSMVGYGEIKENGYYGSSNLFDVFKKELGASSSKGEDGIDVISKSGPDGSFLGLTITKKEDVYPALKELFKKEGK